MFLKSCRSFYFTKVNPCKSSQKENASQHMFHEPVLSPSLTAHTVRIIPKCTPIMKFAKFCVHLVVFWK